jgi:hypothetical protein
MNQIREMLLMQRTEFTEKLRPTLRECGELQTQLDVKLEQVRVLKLSISQIDTAIAAIDAAEVKRGNSRRPKIMDVVLGILDRAPNGLTAREIMTEINTRNLLGEPILRHSLSPQLSRLKDRDKKIELRGDKWFRLPDEPLLFGKVEKRI